MQTETVPIDSLSPDPANARKHDERNLAAIRDSLRAFGQQKPIVVDQREVVIAGNGTLEAAKRLGWSEIAIVRTTLDQTQATAFGIADNRTAELAEWDDEVLRSLLDSMDDETRDLLAFDQKELDAMLPTMAVEVVEDEVPEEVEPRTKPGDLWLLGRHRLLCGDSTKSEDVDRLMDGETEADLILTDPPYGVAYQTALSTHEAAARNRRKDGLEVANDDLGWDGTKELVHDSISNVPLKKGGAFYVFCPPGDLQAAFFLGLKDADLLARHQIVWIKDRFVMGRCDYHYKHEVILYGWKDGGSHYFVNDRTQDSVWEFKRPGSSKDHPTMKPIELVSKPIQNSSRPDELIVDPFLGSGTTLIAAEQLDRRCYGIEIDPTYCDVIVKRWENLTGDTAVLEA